LRFQPGLQPLPFLEELGLFFYVYINTGVLDARLLPECLLNFGLELGLQRIVGLFLLLGAFLDVVVEDMPHLAEDVLDGHLIVFKLFEPFHRFFIGPAIVIFSGQKDAPDEDIVNAGGDEFPGFFIEGFHLIGNVDVLFQVSCRQPLSLRLVLPLETLFFGRLTYPGQFLHGYFSGTLDLAHNLTSATVK
jgi:hypothetical protein